MPINQPFHGGYPPIAATPWNHPPYQKFFTDAVRPTSLTFEPQEGYVEQTCIDENDEALEHPRPEVVAAISKQKLFDLYLAIVAELGEDITLVVGSTHASGGATKEHLHRENMHNGVFRSIAIDYEDLILNDGNLELIAVDGASQVELIRQRTLYVSGDVVERAKRLLEAEGVRPVPKLLRIEQVDNTPYSSDDLRARCEEFVDQLCFTSEDEDDREQWELGAAW